MSGRPPGAAAGATATRRGRARNARPRDGLGRPLPRDAAGVERVPDDLVLPPAESLAEAQRLLDAGRPFHAHEVLEGTWKAAPQAERDLWQGLAQLAVGLTHLARGNPTGAVDPAAPGRRADRAVRRGAAVRRGRDRPGRGRRALAADGSPRSAAPARGFAADQAQGPVAPRSCPRPGPPRRPRPRPG